MLICNVSSWLWRKGRSWKVGEEELKFTAVSRAEAMLDGRNVMEPVQMSANVGAYYMLYQLRSNTRQADWPEVWGFTFRSTLVS